MTSLFTDSYGEANLTELSARLNRLATNAAAILDNLRAKEGNSNQWLVILGLTKQAITKLDTDKENLCGIPYRFQWEGTVGIIKIPGPTHDYLTDYLSLSINDQLASMGISLTDRAWGSNTTYKSTTGNKGNQADRIFTPATRTPQQRSVRDWPTVVIETGVTKSYPKLIEDIKWWFANSNGSVRIIIVIIVRTNYVKFEKWQLIPPNAPTPITRAYIDQLKHQTPNAPVLPNCLHRPGSVSHCY